MRAIRLDLKRIPIFTAIVVLCFFSSTINASSQSWYDREFAKENVAAINSLVFADGPEGTKLLRRIQQENPIFSIHLAPDVRVTPDATKRQTDVANQISRVILDISSKLGGNILRLSDDGQMGDVRVLVFAPGTIELGQDLVPVTFDKLRESMGAHTLDSQLRRFNCATWIIAKDSRDDYPAHQTSILNAVILDPEIIVDALGLLQAPDGTLSRCISVAVMGVLGVEGYVSNIPSLLDVGSGRNELTEWDLSLIQLLFLPGNTAGMTNSDFFGRLGK